MQVTLMVERNVIPGEQESVKCLLRELRSNATRQPGFISGQSVIDAFSPTRVMTITTWTSMAAWEAWENSPERVSITSRIVGLLQEPPAAALGTGRADRLAPVLNPGSGRRGIGVVTSRIGME